VSRGELALKVRKLADHSVREGTTVLEYTFGRLRPVGEPTMILRWLDEDRVVSVGLIAC
jgi:hypothetical protein